MHPSVVAHSSEASSDSTCESAAAGSTFMTGSTSADRASGLVNVALISVGAEFDGGVP